MDLISNICNSENFSKSQTLTDHDAPNNLDDKREIEGPLEKK